MSETLSLTEAVNEALLSVDDPEYPGVSIVDLGLVESVEVGQHSTSVGLIPTFSGCPALAMIAADVKAAVETVDGVEACEVTWLQSPVWTKDRVSARAKETMARELTVTFRTADGSLICPACGNRDLREQSMAGPTRCRSVGWCPSCRNPIEIFR